MSGGWNLSEIEGSDYHFLMELLTEENKKEAKKEERQDAMSFFGTILSPQDLARAKGEID